MTILLLQKTSTLSSDYHTGVLTSTSTCSWKFQLSFWSFFSFNSFGLWASFILPLGLLQPHYNIRIMSNCTGVGMNIIQKHEAMLEICNQVLYNGSCHSLPSVWYSQNYGETISTLTWVRVCYGNPGTWTCMFGRQLCRFACSRIFTNS